MSSSRRLITSLIGPRGSGKTSVGRSLAQRLQAGFIDLDTQLTELYSRQTGRPWPGAGEILASVGEQAFRKLESRALAQVLDGIACSGGSAMEPRVANLEPIEDERDARGVSPDSANRQAPPEAVTPDPVDLPASLRSSSSRQPAQSAGRVVLATGGGVIERALNRERLAKETDCVRLVVPPARLRERLAADATFRPALQPASEGSNALDEIEAVLERREPLYNETSHFTLDCGSDDIEELAARIQAWLESPS